MSNNNEFMNFFDSQFTKNLAGFSFPFDIKSMMESQTRNMQAFSEAQQLALEGMQAIAQRQSELVSQIVQDNTALAQSVMNETTPEQKLAKQADMMKKVYEQSMRNLREINDILTKSNQDASDILNKRVSASLNEVKAAVSKTKATAKKAA